MNRALPLILCLIIIATTRGQTADDSPASSADQLKELVKQLQSGDDDQRRLAARELCEIESREAFVVKALGKATRDRDQQVFSRSAEALARLGPDAAPAINFLIDRLEDRDQQRRYRAAYALGRMGEASVPALQKIVKSKVGRYRVAAAIQALSWSGSHATPVIPDLIFALESSNEEVANAASETLGALGSPASNALLDATESENAQVRRLAAQAIGQLEDVDTAWSIHIAKLTSDSDAQVRAAATRAFSLLAKRADGVEFEPLLDRLDDDDVNVRHAAAQGVIRIRRCWAAALPNVKKLFDLTAEDVSIAAHVVARMGPLAADATETLLTTIEKRPDQQEPISIALSQIGPGVVEPLVAAVRDKRLDIEAAKTIVRHSGGEAVLVRKVATGESEERIISAKMLGAVRPVQRESIDCLVNGLSHEDQSLRIACVIGIGAMGLDAKPAEPAVRQASEKDPSEEVQAAALTTLFKIGVDPVSLAGAIVAGLGHENSDIRRECAKAMKRFEALSSDQLAALVGALDDPDVVVRLNVVEALSHADKPSADTVAKVVAAIDDPDARVRTASFDTLETFGEAAAPAVPALVEYLEAKQTRLAVLRTIAAIGSGAGDAAGPVKTLVGNDAADVRASSLVALGKIMSDRDELITILTDRLADNDWAVRKQAATLLGAEGEDAVVAVPTLVVLLQNEKDSDYARNALRGIDAAPPEAVPQLVAILAGDSGRRARYYAMHLLKKIGPAAKKAIPELKAILDQDKYDSRTQRYLKQVIDEIEEQETEEQKSE